MQSKSEIKSEKILIKDVFKMWFCIPEYQRPYVWGYEEITDFLDDLVFAMKEKPESEYFLGSFVFQAKPPSPELGNIFPENDLLDGQQRMTTLLLLMAVIRDLSSSPAIKRNCQKYIYQEEDPVENIPERTRLVFKIRPEVQDFIGNHIKSMGSTEDKELITDIAKKSRDVSVQNMANAIIQIKKFFESNESLNIDKLLPFIVNRVLMIYVATEQLEDAFRLFMILNDRGVPLRNSDILKSMNLGAINSEHEKRKYAQLWEEAEGELGDDFDRFLNHIRTILVKDKARLGLLQEFEDKVYNPREKDRATGMKKPVLLTKGKETFIFIDKFLNYYRTLLGGYNYEEIGDFSFDNLIKVMLYGLPATDWVPPLLRYYDKFNYSRINGFLKLLDNKFSSDWISQYTPTDRIEAMNNVIKAIDSSTSIDDVFTSDCFKIDDVSFKRVLDEPVYGRRFVRYLLLKLDYYYQNHDQKMHFETLSVEHILPQNPDENSQWVENFTPEQRELWTHKLGNLVLITRRKNTSQGRLDYVQKKEKYFLKNIDTCPNSLRVLQKYHDWTPDALQENHIQVLNEVVKQYGIAN